MSHPLKNLEEEVKIDIRLIWKALFLSLYVSAAPTCPEKAELN